MQPEDHYGKFPLPQDMGNLEKCIEHLTDILNVGHLLVGRANVDTEVAAFLFQLKQFGWDQSKVDVVSYAAANRSFYGEGRDK